MKDNIRFIYGAGFIQVDVTEKAGPALLNERGIFVPKTVSFNELFTDVLPGEEKQLLIQFDDKTFISLPETRTKDFLLIIN